METPDPPSDTPGASKKVFLTPHMSWILRAYKIPTAGLRLDRMNVTEDGILFDRTPLGAWAEGLEGGNQGISSYPLKEGHENRGEKTCISD